jgi:hypothetical protein
MAATKSFGQLDLGPRRVGIHFRKPACRSVACGEVLGWGLAGTSTPAHDRQALLIQGSRGRSGQFASRIHGSTGSRCQPVAAGTQRHQTTTYDEHPGQRPCEAVQQSDAADEGRLEAGCSIMLGRHRVVRLSS